MHTNFKPLHLLSDLHDNPCALVSQSVIPRHHHRPDVSVFPEVHVRAADPRGADVDETFIGADGGDIRFDEPQVILWACVDGEVLGFAGCDVHFGQHGV